MAVSNRLGGKDVYSLFCGVLLILFMGFRYETGCDWYGYLHRWNNFDPNNATLSMALGGELGFALLVNSLKLFGLNYFSLNVVSSIILVFCYFRYARFYDYFWVTIALFFPIIMVQLGMSGIRQALAGGFLLLSFNAYLDGKKIWVAIWVFIASQFHVSAISFLPLCLLAGERISSVRLTLAAVIFVPLSALLLGERVDQYQARYGSGEVTSGGALVRYALSLWVVPIFYVYRRKIRDKFPREFPLLSLAALVISSLLPLVALSSIALHRLNYYVVPLSILLCVYVGSAAFKRPIIGHSFALALYSGYMVSWFLTSRHAGVCYMPYENVLFL